jgi:hypothetical protein
VLRRVALHPLARSIDNRALLLRVQLAGGPAPRALSAAAWRTERTRVRRNAAAA